MACVHQISKNTVAAVACGCRNAAIQNSGFRANWGFGFNRPFCAFGKFCTLLHRSMHTHVNVTRTHNKNIKYICYLYGITSNTRANRWHLWMHVFVHICCSGDTCTFTHILKTMRSQNAVVSRCTADLSSEVRLWQPKHFYFQTGCGYFAFVCEPHTIRVCAYAEMFAARFQRTLHNYEAIQQHQQQPTSGRIGASIQWAGTLCTTHRHLTHWWTQVERERATNEVVC